MIAHARALAAMAGFIVAILSLASSTPAQEESKPAGSRLSGLLGAGDSSGFARATEPREFSFPADHGPHGEFRNEWWYVTGNLDGEGGRRFGFELTFFRFALTPELPRSESAWRTNQVYIAHFAVTDADRERFFDAERFSRGAVGLAGAAADPFRVWIDDWQMQSAGGTASTRWTLAATDEAFAIDVTMHALKPPVLNGVGGLSQKSAEPGNASYYYSITRWQTDGLLRIGDETFEVSGLSWLDREWSSSALGPDQEGWDWFALQLSDGTDLMFYNLRKTDGGRDPHSAGTFVGPDGESTYIDDEGIAITVLDTWESPAGGRYPAAWRLEYPGEGLSLEIRPVMADQELFATVRYWEGAVDVTGTRGGLPIRGRGYVELTGYAD